MDEVQRLFYAANPSQAAFYESTFDEVLLIIQGQVDKWRIERRNAYNLYCMHVQSPVSIFDFNPLPYDDELQEGEMPEVDGTETMEQYYTRVKAEQSEHGYWLN